jgi:hypothetical protein
LIGNNSNSKHKPYYKTLINRRKINLPDITIFVAYMN